MSVRCAHCQETHYSVDTVLLCSQGYVGPCGDLVDGGYDEDGGRVILSCEAAAYCTPRGHECENGHSYVNMEVRAHEGWDYFDADDIGAAKAHGILVFTGPDGETKPW